MEKVVSNITVENLIEKEIEHVYTVSSFFLCSTEKDNEEAMLVSTSVNSYLNELLENFDEKNSDNACYDKANKFLLDQVRKLQDRGLNIFLTWRINGSSDIDEVKINVATKGIWFFDLFTEELWYFEPNADNMIPYNPDGNSVIIKEIEEFEEIGRAHGKKEIVWIGKTKDARKALKDIANKYLDYKTPKSSFDVIFNYDIKKCIDDGKSIWFTNKVTFIIRDTGETI